MLPDQDAPERAAFIDQKARFVPRMLFRPAENLNVAGQLRPLADVHLSQHAEGANSNPGAERRLGMGEKGAEGDMATGPDTFQSKAVVSNAQVTSRHAGQKGEQVGKKQIWLMPAAKTSQAGCRENEQLSDEAGDSFRDGLQLGLPVILPCEGGGRERTETIVPYRRKAVRQESD